jgi:hypothetical protein
VRGKQRKGRSREDEKSLRRTKRDARSKGPAHEPSDLPSSRFLMASLRSGRCFPVQGKCHGPLEPSGESGRSKLMRQLRRTLMALYTLHYPKLSRDKEQDASTGSTEQEATHGRCWLNKCYLDTQLVTHRSKCSHRRNRAVRCVSGS